MQYGQVRGGEDDLAAFADMTSPTEVVESRVGPNRIVIDPEQVEKGLSQLVLSVIELLRRLIEKQAIRRIEGGSLTPEQIEKLGLTLMRLETQMDDLKRHFDIDHLNIDLGPLGQLLDD